MNEITEYISVTNKGLQEATEPIIAHQANCFCTMGTGVALALRKKWPKVYEVDCQTTKGDIKKLGTLSIASVNSTQSVYNIYSQYSYGRDKLYTNYQALKTGLTKLFTLANKRNCTIALPYKIGCNNAGGDWSIVYSIIKELTETYEVKVNLYRI